MSDRSAVFPLIPRRRLVGVRPGYMPSIRRGTGYDPAGSRPYRPGDDLRRIDRHASARLSSAMGRDELVVREYYAEEGVRVVVSVDRRPTMSLFPQTLPWLQKARAAEEAGRMIGESAREARSLVHRVPGAPDAGLASALGQLLERRRRQLPAGSFVFLVSDFLAFPPERVWESALAREWDVVPVLVQDPVWEQTFPDVAGAVLPVADPATGRVTHVRLSARTAGARKEENEARLERILGRFAEMGLAPVRVSHHEPAAVHAAFLDWADERRHARRWLP